MERECPRRLGGPGADDSADRLGASDRRSLGSASLTGAGYANYAPVDEPIERVRLAFGAERFARLASIKARYDPDNLFRFNHNIPPAALRSGSRPGPRSLRRGDVARLERTAGARDELLDPQLRVAEQLLAARLERDATLVQRDRGLERLTAGLELGDGPLQLGQGVVEAEARSIAGSVVVATGLLFVAVRSAGRCAGRRAYQAGPRRRPPRPRSG